MFTTAKGQYLSLGSKDGAISEKVFENYPYYHNFSESYHDATNLIYPLLVAETTRVYKFVQNFSTVNTLIEDIQLQD